MAHIPIIPLLYPHNYIPIISPFFLVKSPFLNTGGAFSMKIPYHNLFSHENPRNLMEIPWNPHEKSPRLDQSQALLSASLLLRCDVTASLKSLARKDVNGHVAARDAVGPPGRWIPLYIFLADCTWKRTHAAAVLNATSGLCLRLKSLCSRRKLHGPW